ncbi:uncharacterized protein LOC123293760 [Chrysoperla carnea]|uniref:uncharacterized protein LOC123293760 n=1 Tax=Chrysoperla carnea TaxID=189513 RepID=UPI001D08C768|nr:uncharacterized protein LOC123293760 [Chrysoperla carnea]
MSANKIKNFIINNSVAIVMIPTVIGLHWGWNEIQHNDKFVKPSERKELPIMIILQRTKQNIKDYFVKDDPVDK